MYRYRNLKNCLLLSATLISATQSNAFDSSDSPYEHTARNKIMMQSAHALLTMGKNLKQEFIQDSLQATSQFVNEKYNQFARYSKLALGYSTYYFSNVLKSLSYTANISATSTLYSSKVFSVIGMLDEVGKDMNKNAYGLTNLGINILGANHESHKKLPNTYISNLIYGVKETAGISSVLGGTVTQGLGICSRILGLTGKAAKTVSYTYVAPSLASIGKNLSFAAHGCDSFSQMMFESL